MSQSYPIAILVPSELIEGTADESNGPVATVVNPVPVGPATLICEFSPLTWFHATFDPSADQLGVLLRITLKTTVEASGFTPLTFFAIPICWT